MNRITGQILKFIIILYCCSCVTIINCDNEKLLYKKRSFMGGNMEKPIDKSTTKPLEISGENVVTALPSIQSELKNQRIPANVIAVKNPTQNSLNDTKPGDTKNITPKILPDSNNSKKVISATNTKNTTNSTSPAKKSGDSPPPNNNHPADNRGALLRGATVFLGLSIVVVAYIIFRCARLTKNRTQMVRKYGILAHRHDVEMRPLPLDDEDEDDMTVFDASEVASIHNKKKRIT